MGNYRVVDREKPKYYYYGLHLTHSSILPPLLFETANNDATYSLMLAQRIAIFKIWGTTLCTVYMTWDRTKKRRKAPLKLG